jgi:hypothetical protein
MPYRLYRTLSDAQIARMERLPAWAHLRGDTPDLWEWLAGTVGGDQS